MTPRSARIERVSMATAGVGIGPSSSTSIPTEVKPATSAVFDHVARQPGVLADHHPVAVIAAAKHDPGGLADPQRKIRRDRAIGAAANPIGTEIFSSDHPVSFSGEPHPSAPALLRSSTDGIVKKDYYRVVDLKGRLQSLPKALHAAFAGLVSRKVPIFGIGPGNWEGDGSFCLLFVRSAGFLGHAHADANVLGLPRPPWWSAAVVGVKLAPWSFKLRSLIPTQSVASGPGP